MVASTISIAGVQLAMATNCETRCPYAVPLRVFEGMQKTDCQLTLLASSTRAPRFVAFWGKAGHPEMGDVRQIMKKGYSAQKQLKDVL
jgi:hypothetical protein